MLSLLNPKPIASSPTTTKYRALHRWSLPVAMAALWLSCSNAAADPVRRSWAFEQLAELPPTTRSTETRHSLRASVVSYPNLVSLMASGILDFRELEIQIQFSRRFYFDSSTTTAQWLNYERDTADIEIARYQALARDAYGRLALGFVKFLPELSSGQQPLAQANTNLVGKDKQNWIHLGIGGGVLPHDNLPWDFRFGAHVYRRIDDDWMVIFLRTDVLRDYWDGALKVGGYFSWSNVSLGSSNDYRVTTTPVVAPVIEHYAFTLGPELEWRILGGDLQISIPLRLYLDLDESQSAQNPPTGPVYYPSEFMAPAIAANYTLLF